MFEPVAGSFLPITPPLAHAAFMFVAGQNLKLRDGKTPRTPFLDCGKKTGPCFKSIVIFFSIFEPGSAQIDRFENRKGENYGTS